MSQPDLIASALPPTPRARGEVRGQEPVETGDESFANMVADADADAEDAAVKAPEAAAKPKSAEAESVTTATETGETATPAAKDETTPIVVHPALIGLEPQPVPAWMKALVAATSRTPTSDAAGEAPADTAATGAVAAPTQAPLAAATPAAPIDAEAPAAKSALQGVGETEAATLSGPAAPTSLAPGKGPDLAGGPGANRADAAQAPDAQAAPAATNTDGKPATAQSSAAAAQPQAQSAQPQADALAAQAADSIATPAGAAPAANAPLTASTEAAVRPQADAHPALRNAPEAAVQVYTRMIERMDGRAQRFEIRLDPAELGRVDVRIEVGADKRVHAILAVHDSAALTDLVKGQKALEQALTDAGVDLAEGGVSFQLSTDTGRGFGAQRETQTGAANAWRDNGRVVALPDSAELAQVARPAAYGRSRLNLVA